MRKILLSLTCAAIAAAALPLRGAFAQQPVAAQASAAHTEKRPVTPFSAIVVHAPLELHIRRSNSPSLQVSAPPATLRRLTTRVENDHLTIQLPDTSAPPPIRMTVSTATLRTLVIAGSARVQASDLRGPALDVRQSGSGVILLDGDVDRLTVRLDGSGVLDLGQLRAQHLDIDLGGSGQIQAHASKSAQVGLSGSGRVVISGNPAQRSVSQTGAGQIEFQ